MPYLHSYHTFATSFHFLLAREVSETGKTNPRSLLFARHTQMHHKRSRRMSGRNHGINANIEILVIPVNLPVGNGDIPTLILWQQRIKIGLIPNGISFQMFKVLHMFAPRGYAFFVPLGGSERSFGIAPTFTGHRYYSKKTAAFVLSGFRIRISNACTQAMRLWLSDKADIPRLRSARQPHSQRQNTGE